MTDAPPPTGPYRGLAPFEEEDAPYFFGRDRDTSRIISNVLASRLTLLYGPSGVGKSSVLRAGVARQLHRMTEADVADGVPPSHLAVPFSTWSGDPSTDLLAAVRVAFEALPGDALPEPPEPGLAAALRTWTRDGAFSGTLVLLLDQFEEYFLYRQAVPAARAFADDLADLLRPEAEPVRVHVLLSFRADALAQLDVFKGKIPGVFENYLRIDYLTAEQAAEAITGPVERFNERYGEAIEVEPALVDAVLHDVREGRLALESEGQGGVSEEGAGDRVETPFLQLVLSAVWARERENGSDVLRHSTYAEGLGGAETIIRSHLGSTLETLAPGQRDITSDVFRYLVTPSGTKYAMSGEDLARFTAHEQAEVEATLQALASPTRRVLRAIPAVRRGGPTRYEIYHDRLAPAALDWRTRYAAEREAQLAEAAALEALAAQRRRSRIRTGLAVLALAVVGGLALVYGSQNQNLKERTRQARMARDSIHSVQQSLEQILEVFRQSGNLSTPDGAYVIDLDNDNSLRVVDMERNQPVDLPPGLPGEITAVALDSAGTRLALSQTDNTVQVWPFPSLSAPEVVLPGEADLRHERLIRALAFSGDGRALATGDEGGTVYVWNAGAGDATKRLVEAFTYGEPVVAFSRDGGTGALPRAVGRAGRPLDRCSTMVYVRSVRSESEALRVADRTAESGESPVTFYYEDRPRYRYRVAVGQFCSAEQAEAAVARLRSVWPDPRDVQVQDRLDGCPRPVYRGQWRPEDPAPGAVFTCRGAG